MPRLSLVVNRSCVRGLSVRDRGKESETRDIQMNREIGTGKPCLHYYFERMPKHSWMSFFVTFGMIPDSVDQMLAGTYVMTRLSF